MKIRTAVENDKFPLMSVINNAYAIADFFKYEKRIDEEEMNRYFSSGIFLVLEDTVSIIACIYYKLIDKTLRFNMLSVDPGKQGKGLSKLLIQKVEEIAHESKCDQIEIDVVNVREPLFPFYQKIGFVIVGTKPFPKPTKIPCHLISMVKYLNH